MTLFRSLVVFTSIAALPWVVACHRAEKPDQEKTDQRAEPSSGLGSPPSPSENGTNTKTVSAAAPAPKPASDASADTTGPRGLEDKARGADPGPAKRDEINELPLVKRLVITRDVKEREPLKVEELHTNQPVVAFVELKNGGDDDASVIVVFEHESGSKVGFIELPVPAESPRYRTWGRTRNITESGTWSAVVRTPEGVELARQSFTVTG